MSKSPHRAIILTALAVELRAALRHITNWNEEVVRDTVFYCGRFQGWDVALAEVGAGNPRAAAIAERAIQHFSPKVALFVGVAGGLKDVRIGDVVVATKIYAYEVGKEAGRRFKFRPEVNITAHALEQRARAIRQKNIWQARLDPSIRHQKPQIFVGAIAAGEKVVASSEGRIAKFLQDHCSDALAVEMEGRGFLDGVQINSEVNGCVIRGISDLLGNKSEADAAGYQIAAADAASAVAFEMLAGLYSKNSESIAPEKIQKEQVDTTSGALAAPSAKSTKSRKPPAAILDQISLRECLNDPNVRKQMKLSKQRGDALAELIFERAIELKIEFCFTPEFKADVVEYGIDINKLIALILWEFGRHSIFIHRYRVRNFSPKYFPMRDGIVCVVSRAESLFSFLSVERADIKVEAQDFWQMALIHYIGCRNLKYRAPTKENAQLLLTKRHFFETTRRFSNLYSAISNYIVAGRYPLDHELQRFFMFFDSTWDKLQLKFDALNDSDDDSSYDKALEADLGGLVACLESLLSLAHKMLLIKNVTDDTRGVIANSDMAAYRVRSYLGD